MAISNAGLNLIKKWEGYYEKAYQCSAGVWTIGWGHTSGVKKGDTCTKSQAEKWLESDVSAAVRNVDSFNVKYWWNQNQLDALYSFAFNNGSINQLVTGSKSGKPTGSTFRSNEIIAEKITSYVNAGGKYVQGLMNRRLEEQKLFRTAVAGNVDTSTSTTTNKCTVSYGQTWLNTTYKFSLSVDNRFSSKTKTACIKAVQTEYNKQFKAGLAVDGSFGTASKKAVTKNNIKKGAKGNITTVIQICLVGHGFDVGTSGMDGSFGSSTKSAVEKFQKANGLTVDGVVGSNTFSKLLK